MLWEIEIQPKGRDLERERVYEEFTLLTPGGGTDQLIAQTARGYVVQGDLDQKGAERLLTELLVDRLVEVGRIKQLAALNGNSEQVNPAVTVLLKPCVMYAAA